MRLPEVKITRRNLVVDLPVAFGKGMLVSGLLTALGMSVPEAVVEEFRIYPNPGWLETECPDRPELIHPTSGHKEFLRHMCINSPVLQNAVVRGFEYLVGQNEGERPGLGDVLHRFIEDAGLAIVDIKGGAPNLANQIHVAFYALAAVYGNFFNAGEARNLFHAQLPEHVADNDDLYLVKEQQNVPIIIEGDNGVDKMMHVIHHAFLAHMLLYAQEWDLQDSDRVPLALYVFRGLRGIDSNAQIQSISWIGGRVWEIVEAIRWVLKNPEERESEEPSGVLEDDVNLDYEANRIGVEIAFELPIRFPRLADVEALREKLNRSPESVLAS